MAELLSISQLIDQVVRNLVANPDDIVIKEEIEDQSIIITIVVKPVDIGKIIGRDGRIFNAIDTICEGIASKHKKKIRIDIEKVY